MKVEYKKLWITLIEKKMSKSQLRKAAKLSPVTLTKLNKDEFISMEILIRLCEVLDCDIGDIVSVVRWLRVLSDQNQEVHYAANCHLRRSNKAIEYHPCRRFAILFRTFGICG